MPRLAGVSSEFQNNSFENSLKIPTGTLLPYFMEDSRHAYVIVPGFYGAGGETETGEPLYAKKTGSDALELIEAVESLINRFKLFLEDRDAEEYKQIMADWQGILEELNGYAGLHYGEQFKAMYHPLVCRLREILYKEGIPGLMKRETQMMAAPFDFVGHYQPTAAVPEPRPVENLDFDSGGSYSAYNWELFFHAPFLMATRLTQNQRFEEAMTWFHHIFNPIGASAGEAPQKYWVTKPFYLAQDGDYIAQRIDNLLYKLAGPDTPERDELEEAVKQWRQKPFKPHVIARFRPVAYQKALLMRYIDNLTRWGDYLFRQDTMESITRATQLYILADRLLGPKPRVIPSPVKAPTLNYNQVEAKLGLMGNPLLDLENILPDLPPLSGEGGESLPGPLSSSSMLYFCIPQNGKMLEYWDRVEDRLFKIRHCRNIDGVERSLALFAPPIDPGMLVRAAASGLDISAVLAGMNAPAPYYRFNVLSQKATALAQEVRGLGASLLQVLEKKDAEAMALLRGELELKVLDAVKDMKLLQVEEAKEQVEALKKTKAITEERHNYYKDIEFMNALETTSLELNGISVIAFTVGSIMEMTAGAVANIPDVKVGVSGAGGSPHVVVEVAGGKKTSSSISSFAKALILGSQVVDRIAGGISTVAGYQRRYDDWKLQERLAKIELESIDKQSAAAEIRKEISETDLKNHQLQIENAKKTDEFMRSRFTNKELYQWMVGQISSVYFRAYQLAYDVAKKAEKCYRFQLGNDDTFIRPGYWDSMKKGLQSAEHLIHDIKRMEVSYFDKNKREYQLTRHVSLAMLDPLALVKLRATGSCDFQVPEVLYDMDHAGHFFRRIKSVSISLPCIVGPYTSVGARLSLVGNRYRKSANPDNVSGTGYAEDDGNDGRFVYNVGGIQSIATSGSQNDSGLFQLDFRDERYLPFEGAGAISSWRLELPESVRQFDYETISDVVIHIKYTAREGGSKLKGLAAGSLKSLLAKIKQELNQTGLHTAFSMKHDFPTEWRLLTQKGTEENSPVQMKIDKNRLPYLVQPIVKGIEKVVFIAKVKGEPADFSITVNEDSLTFSKIEEWGLYKGEISGIDLGTSFGLSVFNGRVDALEDLILVVKYGFPGDE